MKKRRIVLVVAIVLGVMFPPHVVLAAITGSNYTVYPGYPISAGNGLTVHTEQSVTVDSLTLTSDSVIYGGVLTVTGESGGEVSITDFHGTWTNLTSTSTGFVAVDPNDKQQFGFNQTLTQLNFTSVGVGDGTRDFIYDASSATLVKIHGLAGSTTYKIVDGAGNTLATNTSTSSGVLWVKLPRGQNTVYVTTPDLNNEPAVNEVLVPSVQDPGIPSTYTVNVTDTNGLNNVSWVNITIYRNDTSLSAVDSARDHYTVTYDVSANSISSSPSGHVSLVSGLNTSQDTDTLKFDFDPATYAAPSFGTDNQTVNDYYWVIHALAKDKAGATDTRENTTEMARRLSLKINVSKITASGPPNTTQPYSPDIKFTNDGNVYININISATNQTNATTNDVIPANNLIIDDDPFLNQETETGLTPLHYNRTGKLWEVTLKWNENMTGYNWIQIPSNVSQGTYSGNVTYEPRESKAT